jgi:hypothetical protein
MRRIFFISGTLLATFAFAGVARAEIFACCDDPDPERSVAGCTFIIDANVTGNNAELARAYYNRANAHAALGHRHDAVADYGAAIARLPRFV